MDDGDVVAVLTKLNSDYTGLAKVQKETENGNTYKALGELIEHFRNRSKPVYLFNQSEISKFDDTSVIEEAERVYNHDILGYSFGEHVDWHFNATAETSRDSEWTWSLARHNFWIPMARAYGLTKQEKYAREFVTQMKSFVEAWPVEPHMETFRANMDYPGDAWRSIDAAIRIYTAWLPSMIYFLNSQSWDEVGWSYFFRSIHDHAEFLCKHCSNHTRCSNWLTMECSALFQLGVMFPEFHRASEWKRLGYQRICHEIRYQFDNQGVHIERTPVYHLVSTLAFLQAYRLAILNDIPVPPYMLPILERSAEFLMKLVKAEFTLPMDESTGETFPLYGKAVILAAGGDAGLFSVNVHPDCVSGDGYVLGLTGGAEAVNLEFMQIFTMTTAPTRNLIHFWKEEYLSSLYNNEREEFLFRYLPDEISKEQCIRENTLHAPFSVRDKASRYLAVGIVEEIKAGRGTPSAGIYVDLRNCPSFRDTRQDHFFRYRGIDVSAHPVEVSMGFQCCNGGLRVTGRMETTVGGLFAAGENAGGLHGADRLGGNMLAGCIISGRIAGEQAAGYARKRRRVHQHPYPRIGSIAGNPALVKDYAHLIKEIRQSAWENLLVMKSKSSVNRFQNRVEEVAVEAQKTAGNQEALPVEVKNLLVLGKVLAKTTLAREESRGGFYREDYPSPTQSKPEVHLLCLSEAGEVVLRKEVFDPQWNPCFQNGLDKERWG